MVQSNLRLQAFLILGKHGNSKKGEVYKPNQTSVGATPQMAEIHRQNSSAAATTQRRDLGTRKPKLVLKILRSWSFGGLGPFWSWSSLCILPFTKRQTYLQGGNQRRSKNHKKTFFISGAFSIFWNGTESPVITQLHEVIQETLKSNAQEKWGGEHKWPPPLTSPGKTG